MAFVGRSYFDMFGGGGSRWWCKGLLGEGDLLGEDEDDPFRSETPFFHPLLPLDLDGPGEE